MRGHRLIELAREGTVLCDGAMGTMLQARGLPAGACPELWNAEHPEVVGEIHSAYVRAGARIITTNTFGGNRLKLSSCNLQGRLVELNKAGVQLARQAAAGSDGDVFVAASVGPTGRLLEPLGDLSIDDVTAVFAEQAIALSEAGADVILMETFSDLDETKAALSGALRSSLPCFCTMAFDTGGRTMMGVDPVTAARALGAAGASAVGANCGGGPADTLEIIIRMRESTDLPLIAQPNAGRPRLINGKTVYDCSPKEMAEYAVKLAEAGTNIVGACCGSTPEHIGAMAIALGERNL